MHVVARYINFVEPSRSLSYFIIRYKERKNGKGVKLTLDLASISRHEEWLPLHTYDEQMKTFFRDEKVAFLSPRSFSTRLQRVVNYTIAS